MHGFRLGRAARRRARRGPHAPAPGLQSPAGALAAGARTGRRGRTAGRDDAPPHRREHPVAHHHRPGRQLVAGRSQPARAGRPQPGRQRPRCHAGRRHHHHHRGAHRRGRRPGRAPRLASPRAAMSRWWWRTTAPA